jgi:N-carbamoylputrescine amidase
MKMSGTVTVAAVQMRCSVNIDANIKKADDMVREAAGRGAQIILLPELFETLYFCQEKSQTHFQYATSLEQNQAVAHFKKVARELQLVLPISFFEQAKSNYYNSIAIIDASGQILGTYRKTHIPDGPGYEEKFYFAPGDTGFQVWDTSYGKIGLGICWDQWFPEAARCMALQGAELLLYPTAIGSEPGREKIDSRDHWQLCMQGHAAANIMPVIAANRIGTEKTAASEITFYGSSFITNETGKKISEADRASEFIVYAAFDLEQIKCYRDFWGVHRDRRPEMYKRIVENMP